jgi:hypothetical protein
MRASKVLFLKEQQKTSSSLLLRIVPYFRELFAACTEDLFLFLIKKKAAGFYFVNKKKVYVYVEYFLA